MELLLVIKILLNARTITSLNKMLFFINLYQLCILFGTHIVIILITAIIDRLFNKFRNVSFIIVPIIIRIVLVVVEGLTWTLSNIAIFFVEVGILFYPFHRICFTKNHLTENPFRRKLLDRKSVSPKIISLKGFFAEIHFIENWIKINNTNMLINNNNE
jgi:hypothetical protein